MQLNSDLSSDQHLIHITQGHPCRVRGNGIASLQYLQRASLLHLQREPLPAFLLQPHETIGASAQVMTLLFEPQP